MKDIELVIKIPEEVVEYIKNNGCLSVVYNDEVAKAIKNGTPLPKRHGRLIDKDTLIKVITNGIAPNTKEGGFKHPFDIIRAIDGIPTIEANKWIPISAGLPEKSGKYWCTFGDTYLTGEDFYTTKEDAEIVFDEPEEYIGWNSQNVIAWQPLPEPYKVESEE